MTLLETAQYLRHFTATTATEIISYQSWSPEFCTSQLRELPARLKSATWYQTIDPCQLPIDELEGLGFRQWSESWGKNQKLYLIPMWLLPYLAPEFDGASIGDDEGTIQRISLNDIDNDNRAGCLAYGIVVRASHTIVGSKPE